MAYGFFVERYWLDINFFVVSAPVKRSIRVAHLTDLHIQKVGRLEKIVKQKLDVLRPDAIVISGDTIDPLGNYDEVANFLKGLYAPLGVWLVRGNWEENFPYQPFGPADDEKRTEAEYYSSLGVRYLSNAAERLVDDLWILGLDDFTLGNPDKEKAEHFVPPQAYRVAFFHSPEYFDQFAGSAELVLSGHTHGGQVRIPGLPPVYLPPGAGRYVAGWYEKAGSRMYVSRGIGTVILNIRLFCRPEIAIFEFIPRAR